MNIKSIIISYILTTIVFLIIDLAWLGFIAKDLYRKYLGSFLSENVNWTAAIIFYLLYIVGISVFAIYPAVNKDSLVSAIVLGALFGFFAYATYDLTNLATLKDWPITIVVIDIIWGSILTASVSLAGFYIVKFVK
ncbi:MAG: DUF2177 family protein [Melioribacteraceae bacterium]|nr:DUF2177 family protein [Melioribacteraceae bacterium]